MSLEPRKVVVALIKHDQLFIGGRWAEPASTQQLTVTSPATEDVIATVALGSAGDVDAAVAAARTAFDEGPWPRMAVDERRALIRAFGRALAHDIDGLSHLISSDTGQLIRYRQGNVVPAFDYYTSLDLPEPEYRVAPDGAAALIVHEPVGVVAAIMPWNAPMGLTLHSILPALLAGCPVVIKPPRETPLYAFPLAQACLDAGLPDGVLSVVTCDRPASEHLVRHPGVDLVSLVGSTEAGIRIGALCAEQVKRARLELGGKSAAIFLDDADIATAAPLALNAGALLCNGEACAAWTRLLVPRSREAEIIDALRDILSGAVVGDPLDPATDVGPLVSRQQRETVERYIDIGAKEGAKIAFGGGSPAHLDRGWYIEPTLFTDVTNSMQVAREEIFGPVAVVISYEDVEDAVRIANDSPYGLAGAVLTQDHARGVAVAQRIRAGAVGVNSLGYGLAFPFGGFKQSGIGREHGPESLHEVLEVKAIGLPRDHDRAAFDTSSARA
jgi:acyl-CoA reductase-like NAD-dependent aldehyde dehydrogenase